jgi:murein L,D-transpeptidase YafK
MTLEFADGRNETYRVSLGRAGINCNRTRAGDNCTPTGTFFVASKGPSQRFHKFLLLSYPDEKAARRGLETHLISQSEFDAIEAALKAGRAPPQNTHLGGEIGIHGQPSWVPSFLSTTVTRFDWTAACVSVTDSEIDPMYEVVDIGTPVLIK